MDGPFWSSDSTIKPVNDVHYADFDRFAYRFESVDGFFVMIVDICSCLNIKIV